MASPISLFLPDRSLVRTAPNPIDGKHHFAHLYPSTLQLLSRWTVAITSREPGPPPTTMDVLSIDDAATADGSPHPDPVFLLYATLNWYFQQPAPVPAAAAARPGMPRKPWSAILGRTGVFEPEAALAAAEQSGLILMYAESVADALMVPRVLRRAFWQISYPFIKLPSPVVYMLSGHGVRHPVRRRPARSLYRRHVPELNEIVSFRMVRVDDVETVNRWMNTPRVAEFWGEGGPVRATADFLCKNLQKMHSFPVIGSWEEVASKDGQVAGTGIEQPFGYFEVYWVKEDLLGQYCDAQDWERGLHVLVGEDRFRGPRRVKAWLGSLLHFCFCDDPRTMRVTLEPRVDNERYAPSPLLSKPSDEIGG